MTTDLAQLGGDILRRYPLEYWETGRSTGKAHHVGRRILKVEEIRFGGGAFVTPDEARTNVAAIRAWMASAGLKPYQILFDHQPDKAPYIMVPEAHFDEVTATIGQLPA